jgi:hypothetical protein
MIDITPLLIPCGWIAAVVFVLVRVWWIVQARRAHSRIYRIKQITVTEEGWREVE